MNLDASPTTNVATGPEPLTRRDQLSLTSGDSSHVRVVAAEGRRQVTQFIKVPWLVYKDDPVWVPPLVFERRQHLSRRNPYFQHARARFWVAYQDSRPVGRISAQIDTLHLERYHDDTGFFGLLEAIDDARVFQALLGTAESWLRDQGMRRALGPFSLSINDECGLLVEGFDTPPMLMMAHGRPYYDLRLREQGYCKAKDTVAYQLDPRATPPKVMDATVERAGAGRIRTRPLDWSRLDDDLEIIRDIFNDAWIDNWGYVPFTAAEFRALGRDLKLFVPADFAQIAEVDGKPAAMIVVLPNLNESIRDLDGRLAPFGWLRLLWRLKASGPTSVRVTLMGVRKEYQGSALGMALAFLLIEAVRRRIVEHGITSAELSWILEDNRPMRHIQDRLGARVYKRYRIYERMIG